MVNRVKGASSCGCFFPTLLVFSPRFTRSVCTLIYLLSSPSSWKGDVSVKFSTRLISVEGSGEFRSRRVLSFYEKGRIPGLNIDESDINVRKRGEIKGERKDNVGRFQF